MSLEARLPNRRTADGQQATRSRLVLAGLLILGVLLTVWVLQQEGPVLPQGRTQPSQVPDYYIEGVRLKMLSTDKGVRYRLSASLLRQYVAEQRAELQQPRLQLLDTADGFDWDLRADRAEMTGNGARVDLRGRVVVKRGAAQRQQQIEISAEQMTLYPNDSRLESAVPVLVRHFNGQTTAAGLTADLSAKMMALQPRVHSEYESFITR
ncbi:MAG: LPS export ABC transporter periplasmic protein LptC [Gammaproteobacteria bacterium]|nr:LPS export ABC transporter periplasmic protein LptC [Gammaproteobacteria bacterium]